MEYVTIVEGKFLSAPLHHILSKEPVWSARLSTGGFGAVDCSAGVRGPNGRNNVLFANGYSGLERFIELGFIPCISCKPEKSLDWDKIKDVVRNVYELDSLEQFADKRIVPYDVRRILWEEFATITGIPDRFYLPKGLAQEELLEFKYRIEALDFDLPPCGYYDADAPGRFREYAF